MNRSRLLKCQPIQPYILCFIPQAPLNVSRLYTLHKVAESAIVPAMVTASLSWPRPLTEFSASSQIPGSQSLHSSARELAFSFVSVSRRFLHFDLDMTRCTISSLLKSRNGPNQLLQMFPISILLEEPRFRAVLTYGINILQSVRCHAERRTTRSATQANHQHVLQVQEDSVLRSHKECLL